MRAVCLLITGLVCLTGWQAEAKEITLDDGAVSFTVPEDFTPLSEEEIRARWPNSLAPKSVVGSERLKTTIAYEFKERQIQPSQLEEARVAMTPAITAMLPDIEWKHNAVVEMGGRPWIVFEALSLSKGQKYYNIIMITSHKGRVLMFNFNSAKAEFDTMEKVLRESIQSIKITP